MRILVFGASGFIGQAVTQALVEAGHYVTGLVRSEAGAARAARAGAEPLIGDMAAPETWTSALAGADAAIQLAANFEGDMAGAEARWLEGIVTHARTRRFRLIYTGGCWLFPARTEPPIDDETPFDPLPSFAWMVTHRAKLAQVPNIDLTTIHPGIVWSEEGGFFARWRDQIAQGETLRLVGGPEISWPLVHAADLADLYLRALSGPADDYHGVTEPGVTVGEILARIGRVSDRTAQAEWITTAQAVTELGDWAEGQARAQRILSSRAKVALGWEPRRRI